MTKKKQSEPWSTRLGTSTFNPLQVLDLQDALRTHKKSADVQGKRFLLTYTNNGETVFYRPADDTYVPAGYLNIKRFLED